METTKITTEELEELRTLRLKFRQKIFNFGQVQLERMGIRSNIEDLTDRLDKLEKSEKSLQNEYLEIQKEENVFLSKIREKYGDGTMSIETGEFVPIDVK